MKKHKNGLWICLIAWAIALAMFINQRSNTNLAADSHFPMEAEVIVNEEKTGANIRLLQAIHGANGTDYRYSIETDCPKWDFQTKYITSNKIDWVDNKSSAVEVIIYDTQVRYHGTAYASGQYYTVPLLGDISSENVSLEEWKDSLVMQAYQAYQTNINDTWFNRVLTVLIFGFPVVIIIYIIGLASFRKKKENNKGTE